MFHVKHKSRRQEQSVIAESHQQDKGQFSTNVENLFKMLKV